MFHDFPLKLMSMTKDKKTFSGEFCFRKKEEGEDKEGAKFHSTFLFLFSRPKRRHRDTVRLRYSSSTYGRAKRSFSNPDGGW